MASHFIGLWLSIFWRISDSVNQVCHHTSRIRQPLVGEKERKKFGSKEAPDMRVIFSPRVETMVCVYTGCWVSARALFTR